MNRQPFGGSEPLDLEAIRQSPRQFVDLETVEKLADYAMVCELKIKRLEAELAALKAHGEPVAWMNTNGAVNRMQQSERKTLLPQPAQGGTVQWRTFAGEQQPVMEPNGLVVELDDLVHRLRFAAGGKFDSLVASDVIESLYVKATPQPAGNAELLEALKRLDRAAFDVVAANNFTEAQQAVRVLNSELQKSRDAIAKVKGGE